MTNAPRRRTLIAAMAIALVLGGGAATATAANQDNGNGNADNGHQPGSDPISRDFAATSRNTNFTQIGKLPLHFQTYHTEGLAITPDHLFLSTVQIIEPTKKFPTPQGGFDRTPGKGIGHVFVMDKQGNLQKDIVLGEGDNYHPAGMDFDGTNVWVPVAQYRPNSTALIYKIDAKTLDTHKQFSVNDHIGGIIRDEQTGHLVGNNWGSRKFYEWDLNGHEIASWDNPSHFVDYQDCQHTSDRMMICGGITNLPQTPAAGGANATYELGGIGLVDLRSHAITHEIPFQKWSTAGHVETRNPFKVAADGDKFTMWVAPDNGDEGKGTEITTYEATVQPTAPQNSGH